MEEFFLFSLIWVVREWKSVSLDLCLSQVGAVILELQMFKLSPEIVDDELGSGRAWSVDCCELSRMCTCS